MTMVFKRGQNFNEQVAESRRKHVPMYFGLDAYADDETNFYKQGALRLWLTAGDLNKCRQLEVDDSMMRRMGAGHVMRYTSVDEKTLGKTRYMLKLWWHPKHGWHTRSIKHIAGRSSYVFDIPEDKFLKWLLKENECVPAGSFT